MAHGPGDRHSRLRAHWAGQEFFPPDKPAPHRPVPEGSAKRPGGCAGRAHWPGGGGVRLAWGT
eukprot:10357974-Alexandrium_andersonii.AAC.1